MWTLETVQERLRHEQEYVKAMADPDYLKDLTFLALSTEYRQKNSLYIDCVEIAESLKSEQEKQDQIIRSSSCSSTELPVVACTCFLCKSLSSHYLSFVKTLVFYRRLEQVLSIIILALQKEIRSRLK